LTVPLNYRIILKPLGNPFAPKLNVVYKLTTMFLGIFQHSLEKDVTDG
jgi:hypothetical protein